MNILKGFGLLIVVLVVIVFGKGIGKVVGEQMANSPTATDPARIETQLRNTAAETNKSLPMMVGPNIQATSIGAVGKTLVQKYNFTERKAAVVGAISTYFANSVAAACSNPDMKALLHAGGAFKYEYYDAENELVSQYTITSANCINK